MAKNYRKGWRAAFQGRQVIVQDMVLARRWRKRYTSTKTMPTWLCRKKFLIRQRRLTPSEGLNLTNQGLFLFAINTVSIFCCTFVAIQVARRVGKGTDLFRFGRQYEELPVLTGHLSFLMVKSRNILGVCRLLFPNRTVCGTTIKSFIVLLGISMGLMFLNT